MKKNLVEGLSIIMESDYKQNSELNKVINLEGGEWGVSASYDGLEDHPSGSEEISEEGMKTLRDLIEFVDYEWALFGRWDYKLLKDLRINEEYKCILVHFGYDTDMLEKRRSALDAVKKYVLEVCEPYNMDCTLDEQDGYIIIDFGTWYIKMDKQYHFCVSTHSENLGADSYEINFAIADKIRQRSQFYMHVYNQNMGKDKHQCVELDGTLF